MGLPSITSPRNAAAAQTGKERLRREDYIRVKHDKLFSDWKILVGPSDWKDHAAGEEGSQRYKLYNLPATYFGPGVYELGLTEYAFVPATGESKPRKLRRDAVVVVYLGQADNVRQRLQRYGQTGSHLEGGRSGSVSAIEDNNAPTLKSALDEQTNLEASELVSTEASIQGGLRLFTEVFSRGYSIAFRWARTESKKMAEKVESELLHVFDYSWNTCLNGARRPRDILAKLEMLQYHLERSLCLGRALGIGSRKWDYLSRKVGIAVAARKPKDETNPRRSKFSIFAKAAQEVAENESSSCGVLLEDGSSCRSPPLKGRKRCSVHKSRRKTSSTRAARPRAPSVVTIRAQVKGKRVEITDVSSQWLVCGAIVDSGSPCLNAPVKDRKRCPDHKGIRTTRNNPKAVVKENKTGKGMSRTSRS